MRKYLRGVYFGLGAAVLLLGTSLSVLFARGPSQDAILPQIEMGRTAPAFTLSTVGGQVTSLDDYHGKIVVLFFTSPHCPLADAYEKRVADLAKRHASDSHVVFLSINSFLDDHSISACRKQGWLASKSYLTLLDPSGEAAIHYAATRTGTFYVIGRRGTVRYAGAFDDNADPRRVQREYVSDAIDAILTGKPITTTYTQATGTLLRPQIASR